MNKELFQKWWKQYLEKQFNCKLWNDDGSMAASFNVSRELLEHKRIGLSLFNFLNKEVVAQEWQPIETAPKDGTKILLYIKDLWIGEGMYWDGWAFYNPLTYQHYLLHEIDQPTHWMPPKPPITKEKDD